MKNKSWKKLNRKFTLLVVPHSDSTIRSLKIPLWLINGLAFIGLMTLAIVIYLAFSYSDWQITKKENQELKAVTENQAKEIKELQKITQETLLRLEGITETENKIKELVGLEDDKQNIPSRGQGGVGLSAASVRVMTLNNEEFLAYDSAEISPMPLSYFSLENLSPLNKIRNDLALINETIAEKKETLAQLEVDVKARLEYLEAIPSGWPLRGRITTEFGWRPNPFNKARWEYHEGLDIAASYGTPVKAAGAGKVVFAGWKPAYGRTVVINHGYGYTSQYAHNSSIAVRVGEVVKRGQVIARVGNTGRSTGPHLDFRITYNGRFVDPRKILK